MIEDEMTILKSQNKVFFNNKRAISPVVTTALLIIVAVIAIVSFQNWYGNYQSKIFTNTENEQTFSSISIENVIGNSLYLRNNNNQKNITIKNIKINNNNCNISSFNISYGTEEKDIAECLSDITTSEIDVTIFTNDNVISKKFLFNSQSFENNLCIENNNQLKGLWHLDEATRSTIKDETLTNNGYVNNLYEYSNGQIGQAVLFNGINSYAYVPKDESFQIDGNLTFSAWLKPLAFKNERIIEISAVGESLTTNVLFALTYSSAGTIGLFHEYGSGTNQVYSSTINYPLNSWHLLTVKRDINAKVYSIYINGTFMENVSYATNPAKAASGNLQYMTIGSGQQMNTILYHGYMDEISLYNKTLTSSQISDIYQRGANGQTNNITDNLVSFWKFDDSLNKFTDDLSSNNNFGFSSKITSVSAMVNKGYKFNGANSFIYIPKDESFHIDGNLTFSIWLKPIELKGQRIIEISAVGESLITNVLFALTYNLDGTIGLFHEYGSSGTNQIYSSTITYPINSWHLLTITRDKNTKTYSIYINGTFMENVSYATNPAKAASGNLQYITIGSGQQMNTILYHGYMDEISLYNKTLTSSQISDIYQRGVNSQTNNIADGRVLFFNFEEDLVQANDYSGNNNAGILRNILSSIDAIVNKGYEFDGSNSYIYIPKDESLLLDENLTFSVWLKPTGYKEQRIIEISSIGESLVTNILLLVHYRSNGNIRFIHEYGSSGVNQDFSSTITYPINSWHLLTITRDINAKVYSIYINGTFMQNVSYTTNPEKAVSGNTQYIVIGSNQDMDTTFYGGYMDEISLYNRTLAQEEINILYQGGVVKQALCNS